MEENSNEVPNEPSNEEETSETPKAPEEIIPEYMKEIEPKLAYEIDDLYPKFKPFDECDTLEVISVKLEAHRIWKNSLAKVYPAVEDKKEFLDQIMTIFYAFHQNKDSNRLGMEFDRFRNDIVGRKIVTKITHTKLFMTSTEGSYTKAVLKANSEKKI